MLVKNRNRRGTFDLKEKLFFVGSLIVFCLGALLWYNYLHRTVLLTPKELFQKTFVEPASDVTEIEGGNSFNFGSDSWLRFRSDISIHLRNAQEFKIAVAEVGRRWFYEKWSDDVALRDIASNYEFYMYSSSTVGKTVQEWFLVNRKRKRYFYRHWDM